MDIRKTCGYVVHFFIPFTLIWTPLDIVFLTFRVFRLSRPGQRSSPMPTSSQSWHGLVHFTPLPGPFSHQACKSQRQHFYLRNLHIPSSSLRSPRLVAETLGISRELSLLGCGCDGKDSESRRRYSGSSPAVG